MRNQPHKPNSEDIARLAGVSRSTVSRVINGYANVPESTRRRVMDVIERNGYYPSISGQTLRGKRARCVGVFLAEAGRADDAQAALLYAFSQSAQALGYMTLSGQVGDFGSPDCGRRVREVLCSGCVDAGVFLDPLGGDVLIRQLLWEGHTIGTLGTLPTLEHERFFTVETDSGFAGQAVQYALSLGYRQATLLGRFSGCPDAEGLTASMQDASAKAGLQLNVRSGNESDLSQAFSVKGRSARHFPSLVICTDQPSLYAAYRAVAANGFIVGRNVSILAMGLLPSRLSLLPTPTALRFEPMAFAASLAGRMIQSMEGATDLPHSKRISGLFEVGNSCTAVGKA